MGIPVWKGGGRQKISHLGTPRNHKVFVPIWGLTYTTGIQPPLPPGLTMTILLAVNRELNKAISSVAEAARFTISDVILPAILFKVTSLGTTAPTVPEPVSKPETLLSPKESLL